MNSFTIIVIVAIAATAVLTQGPEDPEDFKQALVICKAKGGATSDDIDKVARHTLPTTRTGQCFMACIHREEGIMGADNKIDVDYAKKRKEYMKETHPDLYALEIKALDACKAQEKPETDECVASKKFFECMTSIRESAGVSSH